MRTHDAGIGLSMGYPFVTGCRASSRPQYGRIRWILQARRTANGWSEPTVAPFSGRWDDCDPWISSDGSQLYFLSKRPLTEGGPPKRDLDIWVMAKVPNGTWGPPRHLGDKENGRDLKRRLRNPGNGLGDTYHVPLAPILASVGIKVAGR